MSSPKKPTGPGELSSRRYLEVAVPLPIFSTFTYSLPEGLPAPRRGVRVLAPFRNRLVTGMVVDVHSRKPERTVKPIRTVIDEDPLLPPFLMELARWIADYYFAPLGEVFRVMLPPGLLARKSREPQGPKRRYWPTRKLLAVVEISDRPADLTPRQNEVLLELRKLRPPILAESFAKRAGCSSGLLKSLANKGAIRLEKVEVNRSPWGDAGEPGEMVRHALNPDQVRVAEEIASCLERGGFQSLLLHGVTGSGKTEIYLNAIADALERGKTALMLVPEIGLTPQTARAFRSWFGERVAILHSKLSDGERFDQWRRIREGELRVVIGTRSAVFAPLRDLGIVIVDEEHDTSYKQEELPRYHGRDTALKRAQLEGALAVLGSATPQLEVYYQAVERKRHRFLELPSRILDRPLPTVHVVDMRVEFQRHGKARPISDFLEGLIADRLSRGQQSLILLNRRGYSPLVLCRSCGRTENCVNCSISLTHHHELARLVCHYCGYSRSIPKTCADCGREFIHFHGEGTEKLEEILKAGFPSAAVARLDRDTTERKGSMARILSRFAAGKTDILVGTQMIAKGHDFPGVTLVGVLSADQGLRFADFRAAERTFQLLTQVAGRAGRGEQPGDVVVQTYYPNHYSLKYACAQDYRLFYEREIQYRRDFRYPPFTALANLLMQGNNREEVLKEIGQAMELLLRHRDLCSSDRRMRILGPAPAALEKLKGEFRYQILIKTVSRKELHQVLSRGLGELSPQALGRVTVDIDPLNLL